MSERNSQIPWGIMLHRLLPMASFVGCADIRVQQVTDSSRDCGPGVLFAALRGLQHDGHHFIQDAVRGGAAAVLVEYPQSDISVPQCVVRDSRGAFARICSALKGDPSHELSMVGVTGTNGKTTTTWLARSIFKAAGIQSGVLGTIEYSDGVKSQRSSLTTPDSQALAEWLAAMVACRTTHAAIELSSHALDQSRATGTMLDAAVVTNITHDHLDYHCNPDAYRNSKWKILRHLKSDGIAVLNADDLECISSIPDTSARVVTFGIRQPADVTATILEQSVEGTVFVLSAGGDRIEVRTPLPGEHNVANCLAAAAAAIHAGVSLEKIAEGVEALNAVPGRLEPIDCGQPFHVFVDYAHTDDALRRSISALKKFTAGRIICVFGAGGDRDRAKRPLLGKAGSTSDISVITSDNPRTEDPAAIIEEILVGMKGSGGQTHVEVDRANAIRWALAQAGPGDSVLVAGKGHETEQVTRDGRIEFNDCEVIREGLKTLAALAFEAPDEGVLVAHASQDVKNETSWTA